MKNSSLIEQECIKYGLIDIQTFDPTIKVDLKYASSDNFMHENMYGELKKAYLELGLAQALILVQRDLKAINPYLSLVIYDAARPISIQEKMFEKVQHTNMEKYVANPYTDQRGSFHNYGVAADIGIQDSSEQAIDMGTKFDYFGEEAHVGIEEKLLKEKRISMEAYKNRKMLYYITSKHNLVPYEFEWWHYQFYIYEEDKKKFALLDF